MNKIKTVILAANGPVSSTKTWSNVPACLLQAFRANGIKVITVDVSPLRILKLFYLIYCLAAKRHLPKTSYDYFRSRHHQLYVRFRLRLATLFLTADIPLILLSYSFLIQFNKRRVVLLSDWTYEHYIKNHLGRDPDYAEASAIQREKASLANADLVISIFPSIAERMKIQIPDTLVKYIGHGVNNISPYSITESHAYPQSFSSIHAIKKETQAQCRKDSPTFLFVGGSRYRLGLKLLLEALALIQQNTTLNCKLDVIGFDPKALRELSTIPCHGITAHGYLDKGDKRQYSLYQKIFSSASIFVNVSPGWVGFSSTLEALSAGIPVIVSPNDELRLLFSAPCPYLSFCEYDTSFRGIMRLSETMLSLLKNPNYERISQLASISVVNFSWNKVAGRLIHQIEQLI